MKNIVLILSIVTLFIVSCGDLATEVETKNTNKKDVVVEIKEVAQQGENTNYFATIGIDGMTCEMGCAKTIESKLGKMEGVVEAKVDFENTLASIEYDHSKVKAEDFIAIINSIHDGQYAVTKVIVDKPVVAQDTEH